MNEHKPAHHRPNYILVFLALAVITAAEVAFVQFFPQLPKATFLLSMSFIKAMLVILYFMHLRSDNPWYRIIFFVPFLLVIPLMLVAITQ